MIRETAANCRPGLLMLVVLPALLVLDVVWLVLSARAGAYGFIPLAGAALAAFIVAEERQHRRLVGLDHEEAPEHDR